MSNYPLLAAEYGAAIGVFPAILVMGSVTVFADMLLFIRFYSAGTYRTGVVRFCYLCLLD